MTDRRPVFGLRGGVGLCMKISPSELQALYILRSDMLFEEIMAYGSFFSFFEKFDFGEEMQG